MGDYYQQLKERIVLHLYCFAICGNSHLFEMFIIKKRVEFSLTSFSTLK